MYIDHSVYPELDEPPVSLDTPEDRADYVHRICAAWDFGIHPEPETFDLFRQWREVFDGFPIVTSPGYHAFRAWFGWPAVAIRPDLPLPTPIAVRLDQLEGRDEDPCGGRI